MSWVLLEYAYVRKSVQPNLQRNGAIRVPVLVGARYNSNLPDSTNDPTPWAQTNEATGKGHAATTKKGYKD